MIWSVYQPGQEETRILGIVNEATAGDALAEAERLYGFLLSATNGSKLHRRLRRTVEICVTETQRVGGWV